MLKITISDVGTRTIYALDDHTLTQIESGGCTDGLNDDGLKLTEAMTDHQIEDAVEAAWIEGASKNMGVPYDAALNELSITVKREPIIFIGEIGTGFSGPEGRLYAPAHLAQAVKEAYDAIPEYSEIYDDGQGRLMPWSARMEELGGFIKE